MAKSRFGFDQGNRETTQWNPKYDFAVGGPQKVDIAQGEEAQSQETSWGAKWVTAPEDSHLHSFAFEDYRELRGKPLASIFFNRQSRLLVRFKPPEGHPEKGISEYEYWFTDHALGFSYFEKMVGHTDPGEIVWEMIRAGIPYKALKR
jgi:hypothetical protein